MPTSRMRPSPGSRLAKRSRVAFALAVAAVTAVTISACSGSTSSTGNDDASATFVMSQQTLPTTLDPDNFSGGTRFYLAAFNSLLFSYTGTSCGTAPTSDEMVPQLAKSWEVSDDRKTITVELNDYESQWGNPLTAEDVKYTIERGRALSPIMQFLSLQTVKMDESEPITVVDENTFTINVTEPSPLDLAIWTVPTFTILDKTEIEKNATSEDPWGTAWAEKNSAGFGPWQVDSFVDGDSITMSANPGFTGDRGNVDKLVIKQVAQASDQMQLLQSGSLNYARDLTFQQFDSLGAANNVEVYPCAPVSRDWLILNFDAVPAFADVRVRQAISMALDRDALNQGAYAGLGTPSEYGLLTGVLPESPDLEEIPTGDIEGAKALLKEAGYADGFSFTLGYSATQPGAQVEQLSVLLQSQLADLGITVNLAPYASGTELQDAHGKGTYEAQLWSSGAAVPSAYFEATLVQPGAPNNTWGYDSTEYTALVEQMGAAEVGSEEYQALSVQIANQFVADVPIVSLVDTPNIFAMTTNVSGIDDALGTIMIRPDVSQLTVK